MKKTSVLTLLLVFFAVSSCTKPSENNTGTFLSGGGVFIINEGNFMSGNGSLSFYSYDSAKIYNNLFYNINGRPLGDVPNSMKINNDRAYIVVNNSGKIEVLDLNTLESVSTINGLISPRNISIVNDSKAYVTSMYSDSVAIISLTENRISGYINLRRYSESISISGSKAFVSNMLGPNFAGGNEVMVINTITDAVVDSIEVGLEPESMVVDKNQILWVLCNGGWTRENFASLIGINTLTNSVEKNLVFPTKQASPTCLQIDGNGETLYYLENGVRRMDIASSSLPSSYLLAESDHFFYKMGINPENSDIFITDAVDYQQNGYLIHFKKDGSLISTYLADIIPGLMCFKND